MMEELRLSDSVSIVTGDCREAMEAMGPGSIDAIVTDPPYGLSFMGKGWDRSVPGVEFWTAALRVAKPGCHILAFGGTRTFHRLACAIEDAGWQIRDTLGWIYGSGFPKSLEIGKAIDREAGVEREATREATRGDVIPWDGRSSTDRARYDIPATDAARQWDGWGTALKPAWEPIILARKPLAGTVAATVLQYGTGGLNIDGCRVESTGEIVGYNGAPNLNSYGGFSNPNPNPNPNPNRFPANLIHDGSEEALSVFLEGSARFFYRAKASKQDRDEGLAGWPLSARPTLGSGIGDQPDQLRANNRNNHPTVKPTDLMRYLCRLITPPGGVVLDPFAGSGSTGKAAIREGFGFIGVDLDPGSARIAAARLKHELRQIKLDIPAPSR